MAPHSDRRGCSMVVQASATKALYVWTVASVSCLIFMLCIYMIIKPNVNIRQSEKGDGYSSAHRSTSSIQSSWTSKSSNHVRPDTIYQIGGRRIFLMQPFHDNRAEGHMLRFYGMRDQNTADVILVCRCKLLGVNRSVDIQMRSQSVYPSWPDNSAKTVAYFYHCLLGNLTIELETVRVLVQGQERSVKIPITKRPTKKGADLAICLKCTHGPVDPHRLVEWIEFNRQLGVGKIIIYDMAIHGAAVKIIEKYRMLGIVDVVPYKLPLLMYKMSRDFWGDISERWVYEQSFLVCLNDCIHRFRDVHKYIMVVDMDEVIVPANKSENLLQTTERLASIWPLAQGFGFYAAHHSLHYGMNHAGAPSPLFMQNYRLRTNGTLVQIKCIYSSSTVTTINWHTPVTDHPSLDFFMQVNEDMFGLMHHFRDITIWENMESYFKPYTVDKAVSRYRIIMEKRVKTFFHNML